MKFSVKIFLFLGVGFFLIGVADAIRVGGDDILAGIHSAYLFFMMSTCCFFLYLLKKPNTSKNTKTKKKKVIKK